MVLDARYKFLYISFYRTMQNNKKNSQEMKLHFSCIHSGELKCLVMSSNWKSRNRSICRSSSMERVRLQNRDSIPIIHRGLWKYHCTQPRLIFGLGALAYQAYRLNVAKKGKHTQKKIRRKRITWARFSSCLGSPVVILLSLNSERALSVEESSWFTLFVVLRLWLDFAGGIWPKSGLWNGICTPPSSRP